ncbi:MAG: hypothetical protein QXO21_01880 [Candidatus Anstonellales archaeon]
MSRITFKELFGTRLYLVLENSGPGNTVQPEKDDIILPTRIKLAEYVSTNTSENDIKIKREYSEFLTHDSNGYVADLSNPNENGQESYTSRLNQGTEGQKAISNFNNISNSGLLNTSRGRFTIKKSFRKNENGKNIIDVINDVNENKGNSEISKTVDQLLKENNNFNSENRFIPDTSSVNESDDNINVAFIQRKLGEHSPRKFPYAVGNEAKDSIKISDLKKIGLLMLLESTGENYIPSDPKNTFENIIARSTTISAPGKVKLGQKINVNNLLPTNLMKKINPDYTKPYSEINVKKNDVLSYGSPYNWLTPFAGFLNISNTANTTVLTLLILAITVLIKKISLLFAARAAVEDNYSPAFGDRKNRIGNYLGKKRNALDSRVIFIQPTKHDFVTCVERGVKVFFDIKSDTISEQISDAASSSFKNHGYYSTVIRALLRNTTDFFAQAFNSLFNKDDKGIIKPSSDPFGLGSIADKINNSTLLKFVNILALLGDISISHEENGFEVTENGIVNAYISDIDSIPEIFDANEKLFDNGQSLNPAIIHAKSKLNNNKLSWQQNSIPSLYLFPQNVIEGVSVFIKSNSQAGNSLNHAIQTISTQNIVAGPANPERIENDRIKQDIVKALEEHLEADYMPFYFHDLRTNEIISFHAFLEEISDGFDAEYTDLDSYGRIGSIPIYKNTRRNISLSFRLISTNQEDFDLMWWKVNKLVTLVYPQYTLGRPLSVNNKKFVQPFSQLPSSTPLVRLRIGDLIKTNYSTLALARLFGVGSNHFSLQSGSNPTVTFDRSLEQRMNQIKNRMKQGIFKEGEQVILKANYTPGISLVNDGYERVDLNSANITGNKPNNVNLGKTGPIQNAIINNNLRRNLKLPYDTRAVIVRVFQDTLTYHVRLVNPGPGQDGIYKVSYINLSILPEQIELSAKQEIANTNTNNFNTNQPDEIQSFFSGDGNNTTQSNFNPIIKAFNTTKGKGLAGVIKSIKFDWSDARWVTERFNCRAPMFMKIQMEFTPIHDISPGLDHNGFMLAPVYNVGEVMRNINKDPLNPEEDKNLQRRFETARAKLVPEPTNGTKITRIG